MGVLKRLGEQRWFQTVVGAGVAEYLRFVNFTGRRTVEPPDLYERLAADLPVIVAMWHGQHGLISFIRRPEHKAKALISRHRDGGFNAAVVEWLGVEAIRGSGAHGGDFQRKGAVSGFRAMLNALEEGYSMVLTADVPKVSRVAGTGIVKLAAHSGRPIYPVAVTTSRRIELDNWDRSTINLPFSRLAIVAGTPIRVAQDADEAALEAARLAVEQGINGADARARAIVDGANRHA